MRLLNESWAFGLFAEQTLSNYVSPTTTLLSHTIADRPIDVRHHLSVQNTHDLYLSLRQDCWEVMPRPRLLSERHRT